MRGKLGLAKVAAAALAIGFCFPAGAADIVARAPPPPPMYAPLFNWSGLYLGGHLGGSFSHEDVGTTGLSTNPSGVLGGFQVGYNWQFDSILLGAEAEFSWTSASGSATLTGPVGGVLTSNYNWYDTLAARLGFTQGPWLLYAKAGGAWMNADITIPAATITTSREGWMAGAGVEYMFSPAWSGKVEYSYLDFGSSTVGLGPVGTPNLSTQVSELKVGVNYHFMPGSLFGRW
jgi:outer membrane immunogenic protein